jgi:hypothetical protein
MVEMSGSGEHKASGKLSVERRMGEWEDREEGTVNCVRP